jgi:hypothetical protein
LSSGYRLCIIADRGWLLPTWPILASVPISRPTPLRKCCGFIYPGPTRPIIITATSGRSDCSARIAGGGILHDRHFTFGRSRIGGWPKPQPRVRRKDRFAAAGSNPGPQLIPTICSEPFRRISLSSRHSAPLRPTNAVSTSGDHRRPPGLPWRRRPCGTRCAAGPPEVDHSVITGPKNAAHFDCPPD